MRRVHKKVSFGSSHLWPASLEHTFIFRHEWWILNYSYLLPDMDSVLWINCWLPSGLSLGLEGKWQGQVNRPLPWTYPQRANIFLHHEYYSIFLLQQEASVLWNTVVINNNGILIHFYLNSFLLGVKLSCEKSAQESIFWKFTVVTSLEHTFIFRHEWWILNYSYLLPDMDSELWIVCWSKARVNSE